MDVKNSLKLASGWSWNGYNFVPRPAPVPTTNLAHVYPYNAMEYVVQDALDKWPDPRKNDHDIDHEAPARLLAFFDWLFRIDPQAVVNADFHDTGGQIAHSGSYLFLFDFFDFSYCTCIICWQSCVVFIDKNLEC